MQLTSEIAKILLLIFLGIIFLVAIVALLIVATLEKFANVEISHFEKFVDIINIAGIKKLVVTIKHSIKK